MKKRAFIFPGQGSQYIGMGKQIALRYKASDNIFEEASEALGQDMRKIIFDGDEETLKIIKEGHKKAIDVLSKNRDLLTKVAERLLEKETIMGDEFMSLVKGEEASITGDNVENNENNESDDNLNNDTKLLE